MAGRGVGYGHCAMLSGHWPRAAVAREDARKSGTRFSML
ncbi:hypothetical protein IMCC12053_408 [Celeribacter marinus]|uniref:Uncharacterized protein n=1 Tax=Celeribacter marinus TaxID=1397108 RepID=A0A0N7HI65_9RHOB|nr:hypothetical protein IMCC12053_408 [Celeribacter marinus]